ncbi:S-(hydroxymethyl)glutathione dehydrogenase [Sarracenia purpurea var. burkii]
MRTVAQKWKDLPSRRVSLPAPTSEPEITSRGLPLVQPPPTSESELPCREVSPEIPSASERDLPNNNPLPLLSPISERDLPNPGASPSIPPTMDRDSSPNQGILLVVPAISERDSTNQPKQMSLSSDGTERQLPVPRASPSMPRTFEGVSVPQTSSQLDASRPLTYQRIENIPPTSEKIYIPPSERNYNVGPMSHIDNIMVSESYGNSESVSRVSQRTDTNVLPMSERMYVPTISRRNENAGSSRRTAMAIQTKDDMSSTFDRLYGPAAHQRLYTSHQVLTTDECTGRGGSVTLPTSQRL